MLTVILKVVLALYILQSLLKFAVHFLVPYETRIKRIAATYQGDGRTLGRIDDTLLVLMLVLVGLLWASGTIEYVSFATGLVVGMTLIQVYFHRFREPLAPSQEPPPPVTPIKYVSYAIQANPRTAWREYAIMTVLLGWALVQLVAGLFGR